MRESHRPRRGRGRGDRPRSYSPLRASFALTLLLLVACGGPADDPISEQATSLAAVRPIAPTPALSPPNPSSPVRRSSPEATPARGTALDLLDRLMVKGRAPKTGYDRAQFGPAWADTDRNGCDTRNDILRRDLTTVALKPGTRDCVVLGGVLADPYTGESVAFVRGGGSEVDIDHVVALSDAWQKGAGTWDAGKRLALANDPLNLLAVDASANRAKGDGDAATWLPRNRGFRCEYVARQVAVKARYGVWVTPPERAANAGVLASCPAERAPAGTAPTIAPIEGGATETARPVVGVHPEPPSAPDPDYGTCKNAKAHGAGPYLSTDPEYAYYRDADSDGVVCE